MPGGAEDPCTNDDSKAKTDNEVTNYMDSVYNEISGRFRRLREHLWHRGPQAEEKNDNTPCDQQVSKFKEFKELGAWNIYRTRYFTLINQYLN